MRQYKKPYRIKKKKSIFKNRFLWLGILCLVFIGVFFYFFIFSSFFQVEKIIVSGNEKVSEEEIQSLIRKNVEIKILFFSTKSIFLTNLKKIKENLLNNFPQIADIEMGRGFPNLLSVMVKERTEIAVFCQDENCFLLDADGVIFEETRLEDNLIKIINERRINRAVLGGTIIEKDYLEKVFKIQEYISEEFEFGVKKFFVFEERLNVETREDWEVYFDPKIDLNWQLTKLRLVLEEKIPSERRKDLEYIELRFGDFASFKYKEK